MKALLRLYEQPYDPDRPQVGFDEKSVQLLDHARQPLPPEPGQPRREIESTMLYTSHDTVERTRARFCQEGGWRLRWKARRLRALNPS